MSPNTSTGADRLALRLADLVLARPRTLIVAVVIAALAAASGMVDLRFGNNYRVFFSGDNPELQAFEAFQATYTKNDNILFALQPATGDVFTPELAAGLEWLTAEAWKIPYAIRVDSITNFQHSWADGDDLTVEDLVRDGAAQSAVQLAQRRAVALAEPLLLGNLISPGAETTGINVTLQYPEESILEVPQAVGHARRLVDEMRSRFPDLTVALTGVSMLNNAFAEAGPKDATTLMPIMFGVLVLFMVVVLRSLAGTLATLGVIGFSTVTAFGLAGHLGVRLDPISITAAVIIMTLGIADSVHLLVTMLQQMRAGAAKRDAIRESLRINLLAVSITSLTTVIGFLTLNFSDAPPFRLLGNLTSVGIGAALLYSLLFLPAFLALVPVRVPARAARRRGLPRALGALADVVTRRHRLVLASMGTVAIVLVAMVPSIDLNDEWVKYFDHRITFRGDAEWAMDNLTGLYLLEFSVPAAGAEGISDPRYLAGLERFTGWLRQQPEVRHVYSYADIIKRLNRNLHGDDPGWYRVPERRELAAQYLLLYELSLPYGLDLNDRIAVDKSATRVTATLREMPTAQTRDFMDRARAWMVAELPPFMAAAPTGPTVMFSYISQRNIESMLRGNLLAVVLIAGVMMVALRSLPIGALSIVPNALPILMTFGVWALLVRQVGMAAATVSATSLGIVVDDTVHFLTKYLRARREKRFERPEAIRYAFETVGTAIVSTTVILAFGFSVLALSTFRINAQMGLLTTIAIVLALVTDLLLLPALLMIGHRSTSSEDTMKPRRLRLGSATTALLLTVTLAAGSTGAATAAAMRAPGRPELTQAASGGQALSAYDPAALRSADPAARGYAVAARSDHSDRGFGDSTVEITMLLRNAAGRETTRALSIRTLEVSEVGLGDRSLVIFDSPADIDGTALLSHAKIVDPDDQWLYLPALKRVKRISSVNKSGPFVGSEFAFEDFTALEVEKFTYRWLREEPCGEHVCDVLERYPRYEHSGYTKQISWVDRDVFQIRKVEFYDRRGDLLKTLRLRDYRRYEGAWWRAQRLEMVNHQTGKETDLVYSDYRFGTGLSESDFVRGALQRVR